MIAGPATAGVAAAVPPEARGLPRDGVRLLVAGPAGIEHVRFRDLPRYLRAGDLLVVNTSATLPAAIDGERDGGYATVHFSATLDDGTRVLEVRPRGHAEGPVEDAEVGERIRLPGGVELTLLEPYPAVAARWTRLWRAEVTGRLDDALARHGRPIAYAYVEGRWPLESYQTVFARHPGSAEMPSAGRPFSRRLVTELVSAGIGLAPVTLHAGVSSPETGEPPLPERFEVPAATASRINATRAWGGRVVAVGTTVARAVESAADGHGVVVPAGGWTALVLGQERPARVVDGLITGWHDEAASHLDLMEAVAGADLVRRAYDEARAGGYLWHEFGDSCILLPETVRPETTEP